MNESPLTTELPRLTAPAMSAIERAAGALPPGRSQIHAADLLMGLLDQRCDARQVIEVLAPGRTAEIEDALRAVADAIRDTAEPFGELDLPEGTTCRLGPSGREVLDRLAALAGRTAGTAQLLTAESARSQSDLLATLASLGAGGAPTSLGPLIQALANRIGGTEPVAAHPLLVYRPIGAPPAAVDMYTSSAGAVEPWTALPAGAAAAEGGAAPGTVQGGPAATAEPSPDAAEEPKVAAGAAMTSAAARALDVAPVRDLIERARRSDAKPASYADPAAVQRVLAAVERNPLTVIVSDSADAAREVVTSLAEQLARAADGLFPYRSLIAVDPGYLATQPANALREGLRAAQAGIIFLPNVPRYFDPARSSGASHDLRRSLARGDVRAVGTLADRDLTRLWPPEDPPDYELVYLEPATIEATIGLISSRCDQIASSVSSAAMRLTISDQAIETAARVADRYYRDPPPPGGAIRLLQEAGTAIKVQSAQGMDRLHDERISPQPSIDADDVLLALERLTGIKAQIDDAEKLLGIEAFLSQRVVGQDEAVHAVADAIRRARAGLKEISRPIGSFIFMGPSGVGKTELAKALAELLFDDERAMVRLDMSEYQERHTVSRLLGAPPGYVGYDAGGQLTEPIRRRPYQLVLFDEIEKAHPDLHSVLLQVMDEGRLTDAQGRLADFRNTVIIMTGNVGSEYFELEPEMGREKVVEAVRQEAKRVFRPEFLGRVDEFLVFHSLGPNEMRHIVDIQERKLNRTLSAQQLSITFGAGLKEHLATIGYAPELGARPLANQIRTIVERPLSRLIIEGRFVAGDAIAAELGSDGAVSFSKA